jgi:hypothetical protein
MDGAGASSSSASSHRKKVVVSTKDEQIGVMVLCLSLAAIVSALLIYAGSNPPKRGVCFMSMSMSIRVDSLISHANAALHCNYVIRCSWILEIFYCLAVFYVQFGMTC